MKRLEKLEKRAAARQSGKVTVMFTDGQRRKMLLPDVIPLLTEIQIVDISGDGGKGCGRLYDLLIGVIYEPTEGVEL